MVKVKTDLTGKRIKNSMLTVIRQAEDFIDPKSGQHIAQWLCQCDCGSEPITVRQNNLIRKNPQKSCGCIKSEVAIANLGEQRKNNKIDDSRDYGVAWTTNTNKEFYFDLEDIDVVKEYAWREGWDQNGYHYVCTSVHDGNKCNIIKLCKVITGFDYCEHKDRDPFNNRKENLRPATHKTNMQNKSMYKNNTSGFTGVSWNKKQQAWQAYIRSNGKNNFLGYFDDFDDAVLARLRGEAKYFDPNFAPHRELFKQYNIDVSAVKKEPPKLVVSNNTSGVTGVMYSKAHKKWYAQIRYNNKRESSTYYLNKNDAVVARLKLELKYYGYDKAPQRHLFEQYGIEYNSEEQIKGGDSNE